MGKENHKSLWTMEVFRGFLLLLIFAAQKSFSSENAEADNMLLSEFQFHPRMQNISDKGEEPDIMQRQSPDSLSSPGKARVKTKNSEVELTWRNALEMEVTLANGTEETIHLRGVPDLEGGDIPCLYTGSLDHDSEDSEVTVDGCKGDTKVLVEIASENEVGGLLVLVLENGRTYEVQQEDKHWLGDDALEIPPEFSNSEMLEAHLPSSSKQASLPRSVTVKTSFRYDNSLLAQFNNDRAKVKDFLYRVAQRAKPVLMLLNVNLEVRGVEPYNRNIKATASSLDALTRELSGQSLKGPISFFSAADNRGPAGIAWRGTACHTTTGYQININEVQDYGNGPDAQSTADLFVHELGHNLGMRHDFDEAHGGHNGPCDGKGMMSYGRHPRDWSTCSNSDFAMWYQTEGRKCL